MKYSPTGLTSKIAQWITEFVVFGVFMLSGVVAAIVPYTRYAGPSILIVLLAGYYLILPTEQKREYPVHTTVNVAILTGLHITWLAIIEADGHYMSAEGAVAAVALFGALALAAWKDFILGPMDVEGFKIEVGNDP